MDKYHDFNVEDFAEDSYFYAWVVSPDSENERFWNEWIEKYPEKYAVITEARTILLSVIEVDEDEVSDQRVSQLWNQIEDGIEALDKYQQYSAEDFADDPSFFAWVTEPDEATKTFWHHWLNLNPEKHSVIQEAKSLIGMLQFKETDIPQSTINQLWDKIDSRIENLWGEIENGIEAIDQYNDYTAEDFADDPSFFAWVTTPDEASNKHWNDYLSQNPEKASIVDDAKRLIGLVRLKEEEDIPQNKIDQLWDKIDQQIEHTEGNSIPHQAEVDSYDGFTAQDFANDPSFFVWVTDPDEDSKQQWDDYLAQNPEKKAVIEEARALILESNAKTKVTQTRIDHLWQQIDQGIQQNEDKTSNKNTTTRSLSFRKYYAIAASVIILIGAFFVVRSFNQDPTLEATALGEQRKVTLPDGSVATLNADSRISYQSGNWDNNRKLELAGEAFFEVKKGSKFEVETNTGTVAVLGTSFNVFTRKNALKVECVTGKVKLTEKLGGAVQVLTPGMGAKLDQGKLNKYSYDKAEASKWRSGEFNYDDVSVLQVFEEVARQFNVQFEYKIDLNNKIYTYNGGFSKQEGLNAALQFICEPMGLKYTLPANNSKTVVIDVKDKK